MIAYFVRHPTAANLLMLVLLSIGVLSMSKLRRETFPDYRPTEVEVRVVYRGATADEVEQAICQRIEDSLDSVRFVKELRSQARDGIAIVTVEMDPKGNYQAFKDEIDTAITAIDDFPSEADEPVINHLHTTDLVLSILVTGSMSAADLKAYCEDLKERLQQQSEISLVQLQGFSDHQFRIELSSEALQRYGLNVVDVANIIRRQSVNLPAGNIETRNGELTVRFVEERTTPDSLGDLVVVAGPGGAEIHLRDIAKVTDLFELDEEQVMVHNQRAGLLDVQMTRNQDVIRVADIVKRYIAAERQRYPELHFTITHDMSTLVRDRLELLVTNGIQGMLLVFLSLWLFFNFRLSFWVVMSLPVSFLGAFFFMPHLGLTLNMMTMLGLLLALGILMDDGIVIAENIMTHRMQGKSPITAAIAGATEVKGGVFSSFITSVCVFGPLAFLEGNIGTVLEVVPMVLILVLVVSLIEAFFILPAHLGHSLSHYDLAKRSRFRQWFDRSIDFTRERLVGGTVDILLRWRYLWIGIVILAFIVAIAMLAGGILKFQAFPDLDGDVVEARLLLSPGTSLTRTEQVVRRITDALQRVDARFTPLQPGKQHLVKTVYVRFNHNPDAFDSGPHVAQVTAELLTAERRSVRLDEVFKAWRDEVGDPPDVVSLAYTEPGFGPQGRNLEIRLQGDSLSELKEVAMKMQRFLNQFSGVLNLSDDLHVGKRELHIRLRKGTLGLGLDAEAMAQQLRAAYQGMITDEIQVGPEAYEIDVRLRLADRDSLADFENFFFTLPHGGRVPLGAVADVQVERGWSRIARVNGLRTVTLRGDIDSHRLNTMALVGELRRDFLPQLAQDHPGVTVSFEGEPKEGVTTRLSILRGMLVGLWGVFILLSFQFRSYLEPLIVMIAIPFALIGVIAGHLLMGINLSMPSILGFVSLSGIVVNDSILLVLFLKLERQRGVPVLEAASLASRKRFRAIVLTSLTTIAGLLPLLAEKSLQAQVLIPLATSIAFGLLASTVLVLLVIPSLYAILNDLGMVAALDDELSASESSPDGTKGGDASCITSSEP